MSPNEAGQCACGSLRAEWSERLKRRVCARCYFASFPDEEREDSERIDQQQQIANVIRHAAGRVTHNGRRARLSDCAFDISLAKDSNEVRRLLAECARLGVKVGRRS